MSPDEHPERRRRRVDGSARRSGRAHGFRPDGVDPPSGGVRTRPPRRRPRRSGTGGAFGLPSTRRAAVLAIVVCALMLSIAVPLRTYLSQRAEVADQVRLQNQLREQVRQLQQRNAQLSDPAQVEAELRRRLGYVKPGETPYIVDLPSTTPAPAPQPGAAANSGGGKPWYTQLWDSIMGGGT